VEVRSKVTALEVGIVTSDAARLTVFYTDGLGFSVETVRSFPRGSVHRLRRDSARCKLFQPAQALAHRPFFEPWYMCPGTSYGALLVDDAEEEVHRARSAGGVVLEEVASHRPGARYALIGDPDGNVWEILEEG
jgi:predicted enzyme related to lactoylglutathione lyase